MDNVVTAAEDQLQQLIQETKTNVSSFDVMKNELLNAIKQSMTTFEEKMNLKLESPRTTAPTASKKPAVDNKQYSNEVYWRS